MSAEPKDGPANALTLDVGTFMRWGDRGLGRYEEERGRKNFPGWPGVKPGVKCRLARSLPNDANTYVEASVVHWSSPEQSSDRGEESR